MEDQPADDDRDRPEAEIEEAFESPADEGKAWTDDLLAVALPAVPGSFATQSQASEPRDHYAICTCCVCDQTSEDHAPSLMLDIMCQHAHATHV